MRRALVCGGSGGIGSAVVRALRDRDYAVESIDGAEAAGTVNLACDVADADALARLVTRWVEESGLPDALVWSIGEYRRAALPEYSPTDVGRVLAVNLGSLLVLLATLLRERADRAPARPMRIVVVGSQAGATGGRDAVYAAAKAGCAAVVKSVAREYARSAIVVNCVSPGPVDTPMAQVMGDERRAYYEDAIPLGRFTTPGEVADVVAWLCTDAPDALNGTVVDVDGGLVRR